MEQVVFNCLTHDGMRHLKVISDAEISVARYQASVPNEARARVEVKPGSDPLLGLFSLELCWPVFEPYEIFSLGPKKFRRLMLVHYFYAARVSECIELAREAFFVRTHFQPGFSFVGCLPSGAEDGMEVHGVQLMTAEWMPLSCVAVGGT